MDNPEFKIGPDTDRLVDREKSWTRMDKLLLVFGVVVNLGDGVEIYLPGSSNTILQQFPDHLPDFSTQQKPQ